MSDYSCANCGIDTENEPLCLCDECNGPDTLTERLRAELAALKAAHAEELRAVAERQREACSEHLARVWYGLPDGRADHGPCAVVRATPLVTEEK
jgi:predicted ATP-dependent serine protease